MNHGKEGFELVLIESFGNHLSIIEPREYRVSGGAIIERRNSSIAVYIQKQVEWNGEGLPPVGTVCEFRVDEDDWRQCEVIAHKEDSAVCWIHCNKISATNGSSVRPIRTPEQIAAEKREIAIREMEALGIGNPSRQSLLEALYDAGYRKL